MKSSVFSDDVLDRYLFEAIVYLKEHWFDADTGIVAAVLVDPAGNAVFAAGRQESDGVYSHAEKNALDAYQAKFGHAPIEDSVMVVTLSPCVIDSRRRLGESCSNRLAAADISHTHYGVLDSGQGLPHATEHPDFHFTASETKNPLLAAQCQKIFDVFKLIPVLSADETLSKKIPVFKNKSVFDDVFRDFGALEKAMAGTLPPANGSVNKPATPKIQPPRP